MAPKKEKTVETAVETSTPETAAETVATEKKSARAVAKRETIAVAGGPEVKEEEATGVRYTELETGESVEWFSGGDAGTAAVMLANFGALTLFGNIRNTIKNGNEPSDENVIEAIKARIQLLDAGQWLDRTPGERGPKIDVDKMAEAFIEWVQTTGTDAAKAGLKDKATYVQRLLEDKSYAAKVRNIPEVKIIYNKLAGKAASADSLV